MDLIPPAGGSISWCAPFPYMYVVRLTGRISESRARLPSRLTSGFRSRSLGGCVVAQVLEMERINPSDSMSFAEVGLTWTTKPNVGWMMHE